MAPPLNQHTAPPREQTDLDLLDYYGSPPASPTTMLAASHIQTRQNYSSYPTPPPHINEPPNTPSTMSHTLSGTARAIGYEVDVPPAHMLRAPPPHHFQTEPTPQRRSVNFQGIEPNLSPAQLPKYNSDSHFQSAPGGTDEYQPTAPQARGVQLVETIAPGATRRSEKNPSNVHGGERHGTPGGTRRNGKLGTLRSMSMRGKKPTRVTKSLVVAKTDPKSYFSNERTMYGWFSIATIILGTALSSYAYLYSMDVKIQREALNGGTFLSGLSLIIFAYAVGHFYWRRRALTRKEAAIAFDDRLGPYLVVILLCCGLAFNEYLRWNNHTFGININVRSGASFGAVKPTGTLLAANGTALQFDNTGRLVGTFTAAPIPQTKLF